jgi:uncharacterized protein (DUF488 family)
VAPARIYTIGHSTRQLDEFTGLLTREGVTHLADVRTFPFSRRYPHFNQEILAPAVGLLGIAYTHFVALGGRRRARRDSRNTAWRNASFRGYADYMETGEFGAAIDALMEAAASKGTTAIMCAEAVPWRCHRSLIADALTARGVEVQHILDAGPKPHSLTSFARIERGTVRYDAAAEPNLFG